VTVTNVLNVIREREARAILIHRAFDALRPKRVVRFQVYEGNGSGTGAVSQPNSDGAPLAWQENRKTRSYVSEIEDAFTIISVKGNIIVATRG